VGDGLGRIVEWAYDLCMGQAGDVYAMPDGSEYVLRTSTADANGEFVEFEWIFPAGVFTPPPHLHPSQSESYEVLEGELEVMIDGEWSTLREGESAEVPPGVDHTFGSPKAPVRVRNFHRPALGFEPFVEEMCSIAEEKNIRGTRDPRLPIYLAEVWRRFPETLQVTRRRERIGMAVGAAIARVLP
jgi:mannose-6-phosphate isomerase-like protein (cupin superfamily)